jgi:hypothetical protein
MNKINNPLAEKIINNKNFKVLTPFGYKEFSGMRRLKNYLHLVKFESGRDIEVTKDHPFSVFKNKKEYTSRLSDLHIGDRLQTKDGYDTITDILSTGKYEWTYDLLDVQNAVYYGNDIISHNCFLETGQSAVDGELIDKFRSMARPPATILMDGAYSIWEEPKLGNIYIIGVDVGEGVGQAASVAQIFDVTDLADIRQVAVYHSNTIDPFHFGGTLFEISHHWGKPHLLIERNNCGATVIDSLTEVHNYTNIVDYTPEKQKYYDKLGVYSHTNAKYRGVMNMRYWVNSLQVVSLYDIATIQELETFVKYPNGTWKKKAGDYIYDDRVMAMIWCLFGLEPEIAERYFDIMSYDDNGKPKKIQSFSTEGPEYFKLDPFFQNEPTAPLPAYIGINPDPENGSIEDLMQQGWEIPEQYQDMFDK